MGLPAQHLINTPGAIILGMVYDFLPFMVSPIYNALEKIDKNVINAKDAMTSAPDPCRHFCASFFRFPFRASFQELMVSCHRLRRSLFPPSWEAELILLIGNVIEQEFTLAYDWNLGSGLSLILVFIVINVVLHVFDKDEDVTG